jgi:hypothetical protein
VVIYTEDQTPLEVGKTVTLESLTDRDRREHPQVRVHVLGVATRADYYAYCAEVGIPRRAIMPISGDAIFYNVSMD